MASERERLPRSITLLTSWVTTTDRKIGPGISSRRGAGPLRGMRLLLPLRAVAATRLLALRDARRVERATDDLVTHARKGLHKTTAHGHDRVLLQVVSFTRDVSGDFDAGSESHTRDLAQRGVRLL